MRTVTFEGKTLHLEGELPRIGEKAPDFQLVATDLRLFSLNDYQGKVLGLATVPSLDTPVCDLEARHFNEQAPLLSEKVQIVIVSRDLPFAQARWCGTAGAERLQTLSDYRNGKFGIKYGVMIEELKLLARAVFVINEAGILTYSQVVPEITDPPAYAPVIDAIKAALG